MTADGGPQIASLYEGRSVEVTSALSVCCNLASRLNACQVSSVQTSEVSDLLLNAYPETSEVLFEGYWL